MSGRILIPVILVYASLSASAQDKPLPQTYAVTIFGKGGVTAGKSVTGTVIVEGYSSDDEVNELAGILKSKGQDGLALAMDKLKGEVCVALTGTVGNQVQIVRQHPDRKAAASFSCPIGKCRCPN